MKQDELTMGRIGLELDVRLGQVLASLEDARWSQAGCECRGVFGEYVQRSRRHRTVHEQMKLAMHSLEIAKDLHMKRFINDARHGGKWL